MRKKTVFGIDLLKAIAIVVIVIYHINNRWLPGGFIGVDLFFVVTGYLLAGSLIKQVDNDQGFGLIQNIWKRIKQLWPLLFIVVFATTIFITIFNKPMLDLAHRDVIPSLTFTNNWWFIINKVGYFEAYLQSPFKHLWYISVLMQSYILICIVFKISNVISQEKGLRIFKQSMIIMGIASFVAMQILFNPQDISRVYYGTDTRIFTIIIGILGYFYYPLDRLKKNSETRANGLVLFGLSLVTLTLFIVGTFYVSEIYEWVYRVGFLAFAINSFGLLISLGNDNNPITNLFSYLPGIGGLGKLSYGIYLWHFPIVILTQTVEELTKTNYTYLGIRILVILILSYVTYVLVEKPAKKTRKARPRTRKERQRERERKRPVAFYRVALGLGAIFLLGTFGVAIPFISTAFVDTQMIPQMPNEYINSGQGPDTNSDLEGFEILNGKEETKEEIQETGSEDASQAQEENTPSPAEIKYSKLLLIGDSVGINVGMALDERYADVTVDAKVSRQVYQSRPIFEKYQAIDDESTALIVVLGTNGGFDKSQMDSLLELYPKSKKIWVNTKAPTSWMTSVNEVIASYISEHPEVSLVDWYGISNDKPQYFANDGTHLTSEGINAMINLIETELKK